jgi:hypothetical protein
MAMAAGAASKPVITNFRRFMLIDFIWWPFRPEPERDFDTPGIASVQ